MHLLESTIEMKKETQAHYERLAETVANKEMGRLFSLFAAAEGEYIERLAVLQSDMIKIDAHKLDVLGDTFCLYSPHVDLLRLAQNLKNEPDACHLAEQEEIETIEFFDQLSSQSEYEPLKKVCQLLADRERDHLKMLEEIYFFVEQPKTYLVFG